MNRPAPPPSAPEASCEPIRLAAHGFAAELFARNDERVVDLAADDEGIESLFGHRVVVGGHLSAATARWRRPGVRHAEKGGEPEDTYDKPNYKQEGKQA